MSYRLRCIVPYCRRTREADGAREWICAKHWRAVPPRLKWLHRRCRSAANKVGWLGANRLIRDLDKVRVFARSERVWERCKKAAIEAAAGI